MLFDQRSVPWRKTHVDTERALSTGDARRPTRMRWLVYGAAIFLCCGTGAAFHLQFSRDPHEKAAVAALLLLASGVLAAVIGLGYSPT